MADVLLIYTDIGSYQTHGQSKSVKIGIVGARSRLGSLSHLVNSIRRCQNYRANAFGDKKHIKSILSQYITFIKFVLSQHLPGYKLAANTRQKTTAMEQGRTITGSTSSESFTQKMAENVSLFIKHDDI